MVFLELANKEFAKYRRKIELLNTIRNKHYQKKSIIRKRNALNIYLEEP